MSELIREDCILLGLEAADKEQLLRTMVGTLEANSLVDDGDVVLTALEARESVMSTGIGGGVAIPHAQTEGADGISVSVARPQQGVDFDSVDRQPVDLVFLVVGPPQRGGFIRILARISQLLCDGTLRSELSDRETARDVLAAIVERERRLQ